MKRKSDGDYAVKKSFSLPRRLLYGAEAKQREFGYSAFSDYLQALIRADLQARHNAPLPDFEAFARFA